MLGKSYVVLFEKVEQNNSESKRNSFTDKDYPEASWSAFSLSPQSGFLHADIQHGLKNTESIKIIFTAR